MKPLLALLSLVLIGCKSPTDFLYADLKSENGYYKAVIEIPAGTNSKIEYDKAARKFRPSLRNGRERTIDFLAYPANYGFIPSTYSNPEDGGDGDALDIMVLSSAIASGEIVEVIPIGILKLLDAGEQDYKVIAVPANRTIRTIDVGNYEDFVKKYEAAKNILETWFLNYDPADTAEILGWGDEQEAVREIERLRLKS